MIPLLILLQFTNWDPTPTGNIEHADQRMTQACQTASMLGSELNERCLCVQRQMRANKDAVAYPFMAEMAAEVLFKGRARTSEAVVAQRLKAYRIDIEHAKKDPAVQKLISSAMSVCRR